VNKQKCVHNTDGQVRTKNGKNNTRKTFTSNKENPYIKTCTPHDKYSNENDGSYKTALLRESGNTNRKPKSITTRQRKHNWFTLMRITSPQREQRRNNYNIERKQSPHIFKYKEFTNGVQQKLKYTNRNHQERFTKRNETVYIGNECTKRIEQTNHIIIILIAKNMQWGDKVTTIV